MKVLKNLKRNRN